MKLWGGNETVPICIKEIKMRIEFVEVKTKNYKRKVVLIFILAILFIATFSVLGIHFAKMYNANLIAKRKGSLDNSVLLNDNKAQGIGNIDNREQVKNALLPIFTENAKKKISNIYNTSTKIAYLTFDDGPSQAVTPLILDVLKEQNVKATFFVLGANVNKNPDIVKRAYLEGHYIANHGYSHSYSKIYSKPENVLSEYNKTEKAIQKAIENNEYSSHLFRFPGGYTGGKYEKIKQKAGKLLNENDIAYIDWNVLTGDAEGANTKEKILDNIEKYIKDKGNIVVLMHDASTKILTYETLNEVINYLRNQGYTFDNFYNIMS